MYKNIIQLKVISKANEQFLCLPFGKDAEWIRVPVEILNKSTAVVQIHITDI